MAREINRKVADAFAEKCEGIAEDVLSLWGRYSCYHDNSRYADRQFVMEGSHSWGTAYCVWTGSDKVLLKERLRDAGATNIKISQFRWNRFYLTFDMKVATQKELEKEVE